MRRISHIALDGDPAKAAAGPWADDVGVVIAYDGGQWTEQLTDAMLAPYAPDGAPGAQWAPEGATKNAPDARWASEGARKSALVARPGLGSRSAVQPSAAKANAMRSMSLDEMIEAIKADGWAGPLLPDTALRMSVVFAATRVIAEDVAKLPRKLLMREHDGERQRTRAATGDPRYAMMTVAPNDWMTWQELLEYMVGQAVLHGTAHAELVRAENGRGPVTEILPLLPHSCRRVQAPDWSVVYEVAGYGMGTRVLGPREIWCLNGPMFSPLAGANVSRAAAAAIDLARSLEASQTRFHANDARPSGILASKGAIQAEQREAIRAAWQAAYGPGGRGGVAVLGDDFDFKAIATTAADAQLIQNREFQIEEICRFFRVHPWAVMRQTSTQAYASIEQTALAHIQHTIMPWVTRLEETARRDLLDRDEAVFWKLNMAALARTTLTDRVNAYKSATTVYMTPNEVRDLEDMDPIDDDAMDRVQLPANNTGLTPGQPPAQSDARRRAAQSDIAGPRSRDRDGDGIVGE